MADCFNMKKSCVVSVRDDSRTTTLVDLHKVEGCGLGLIIAGEWVWLFLNLHKTNEEVGVPIIKHQYDLRIIKVCG